MRDAFGGVFMIRLFLVFIVIYVAFTAVSLNYAKAFRVKNSIISFIEENEVIDLNRLSDQELQTKLDAILQNAKYIKTCNNGDNPIKDGSKTTGYCYKGILIQEQNRETIEGTNSKKITYQITTFADWNVGMLNKILALGGQQENSQEYVTGTWAINGEAKVISKG